MIFQAQATPKLALPEALTPEYLEHYRVLPIDVAERKLLVAAAGEPDPHSLDDLSLLWQLPVEVIATEPEELTEAIRRAVDAGESVVELIGDIEENGSVLFGEHDELADARNLANQPPVILT